MTVWWVPYVLTDAQEQTYFKFVEEHLKWVRREENFLNRIIAINKTRIQDFEPELKC